MYLICSNTALRKRIVTIAQLALTVTIFVGYTQTLAAQAAKNHSVIAIGVS